MRVLYGLPLPPGVEAPTRGELCIRVEKLLLKDNLVHPKITSKASSTFSRPYSIPANHCAVSPLFWGEQHATCQCVPATPGNPRGVVSLVYPLKTYEAQFNEYLEHMSNSNHRGVQISVFVPTSYSGRHRPIPVGKSIIALDALRPSSPISGWFTILSDELLFSDGSETVTSGVFVDVGKLKVTFNVTFFARIPLSPSSRRGNLVSLPLPRSKSTEKEDKAGKKLLHNESPSKRDSLPASSPLLVSTSEVNVGTTLGGIKQQQQQKEESQANFCGGKETKPTLPLLDEPVNVGLTLSPSRQAFLPSPNVAVAPVSSGEKSTPFAAIGDLLQKGRILRDKMSKALSPSTTGIDNMNSSFTFPSTRPPVDCFKITPTLSPLLTGVERLNDDNLTVSCHSTKSSLETSLTSAAVESVKDGKEPVGVTFDSSKEKNETVSLHAVSKEKNLSWMQAQPLGCSFSGNCYVEVDISQIAFSSGQATLGMEEMRVGICLSKDVKTDKPVESYSSYVHRVPLVRGAEHHIIIGFLVRSFSEKSRMVISFYRVRSAPVANSPGEQLLKAPATAQRVLVEEALLGMCIVGLYSQSRDILLHNPVTGEDPTQAHLRVCLRGASQDSCVENELVKKDVDRELQKKEPQSNVEKDMERNALFSFNGRSTANKISQGKRHHHHRSKSGKAVQKKEEGDDAHSQSCFSSSSSSSLSSLSLVSSSNRLHKKTKRTGDNNETLPCSTAEAQPQHPLRSALDVFVENKKSNGVTHRLLTTADAVGTTNNENGNKFVYYPNAAAVSPSAVGEKAPIVDVLPERFRIHVTIRAGKELPMVTLTHKGPSLMSFVTATDHLENGVRSVVTTDGRLIFVDSEHRVFGPPSTFFVIEDILSAVDSRAASKGVVPDWFVEAAVCGVYDRTFVVPKTQSPQYNYECILSLPRESVFLRHASEAKSPAIFEKKKKQMTFAADEPVVKPLAASLCLQELHLTLWHAAQEADDEQLRELKDEEEGFWAKTAVLGECRVDLRSLRFLKVLDGWYRVHAVDKVNEIVGYVRVSVRLL